MSVVCLLPLPLLCQIAAINSAVAPAAAPFCCAAAAVQRSTVLLVAGLIWRFFSFPLRPAGAQLSEVLAAVTEGLKEQCSPFLEHTLSQVRGRLLSVLCKQHRGVVRNRDKELAAPGAYRLSATPCFPLSVLSAARRLPGLLLISLPILIYRSSPLCPMLCPTACSRPPPRPLTSWAARCWRRCWLHWRSPCLVSEGKHHDCTCCCCACLAEHLAALEQSLPGESMWLWNCFQHVFERFVFGACVRAGDSLAGQGVACAERLAAWWRAEMAGPCMLRRPGCPGVRYACVCVGSRPCRLHMASTAQPSPSLKTSPLRWPAGVFSAGVPATFHANYQVGSACLTRF